MEAKMIGDSEKKPVRVRIATNGGEFHSFETEITDADTGARIERVQALELTGWEEGTSFPYMKARITVRSPDVDLVVPAEIIERRWPWYAELAADEKAQAEATFKILADVANERRNQRLRWTAEHDAHHEPFEWLGLIARYAAAGDYIKAAAVALAAEEAHRRHKETP